MDTLPMGVIVFELPPDADESCAKEVLDRQSGKGPWVVESFRVLGIDEQAMIRFRQELAEGRLRDATQAILRKLGEEGESLVRREAEFQFIWIDAEDLGFGTIHVLMIVPEGALELEAGVCLACLRSGITMN